MSRAELEQRRALAVRVAAEAGAFARRSFLDRDSLKVRTKGSQDWVTNVDVDVESLVRERIGAAYPGEPVLGEEAGKSPGDGSGGMWVVDPIDGTTCFMFGLPQWCVALGYVVDNTPVVAAIYAPMSDEMFSALAGGGMFVNENRTRVSAAASLSEGLVAVGAARTAHPERTGQFITQLVSDGGMYVRTGSCALALCYVAASRLLAAYEPLVSPWDDLAGMLLVREAGGRTNPYPATVLTDKRRPVLAAAPAIWPAVAHLMDDAEDQF